MKTRILGSILSALSVLLILGCPTSVDYPNNNANLSAMTSSVGSLSPEFTADTTTYTVSVPNATDNIVIAGLVADSNATISSNNNSAQSLSVGANIITIQITAQDGTTSKNYVIYVGRMALAVSASNGITMLTIPAGRFQRNSTAGNDNLITQPYGISKYEITRAQFLAVMGADPSNTTRSGGLNDPVQNVSWYSAIAFCNKLSLEEGLDLVYSVSTVADWSTLTFSDIPTSNTSDWNNATANWGANGYRLPTEMEWMWAAMGAPADGQGSGNNTTGYLKSFAGSTGTNNIGDYAVFGYGSSAIGATSLNSSSAVGSKSPNELGIYDLSGNIFEYCWDFSASYPNGIVSDYNGPLLGTNRVCRGGSWIWGTTEVMVAHRSSTGMPGSGYVIGLRIARNN